MTDLGGTAARRPLAAAGADLAIDAQSGWLRGARRVVSPNCDLRPAGCGLELIVVHGISLPPREFGGAWIDRLFTNRLRADAHPFFREIAHLRVSSHVLIRRDGSLTQYVPFHLRAWHAGASSHRGRTACNDFSVGVELEGADDVAYDQAQYHVLAELVRSLAGAYPSLRDADIVGHSDIAPGRKSDPGEAFDWQRFRGLLRQAPTAE